MAQGNSRSAASGRKSKAVSRKRHDLRQKTANHNATTVYPFLGYLRAKCRLFAAVALRNAPAGAVPRTPFTRKGYAASVGGRAADGCPALPLRKTHHFIDSLRGRCRPTDGIFLFLCVSSGSHALPASLEKRTNPESIRDFAFSFPLFRNPGTHSLQKGSIG